MSLRSREIRLNSRPAGAPTLDNFALAEVELPHPAEGEVEAAAVAQAGERVAVRVRVEPVQPLVALEHLAQLRRQQGEGAVVVVVERVPGLRPPEREDADHTALPRDREVEHGPGPELPDEPL